MHTRRACASRERWTELYLMPTTVVSPTVTSAPSFTPVLDIHVINWSSQTHTSSFQVFFFSLHPFPLCSITTWLNDALSWPKNLFKFFYNILLKTETDILASIIFPTTHLSLILWWGCSSFYALPHTQICFLPLRLHDTCLYHVYVIYNFISCYHHGCIHYLLH